MTKYKQLGQEKSLPYSTWELSALLVSGSLSNKMQSDSVPVAHTSAPEHCAYEGIFKASADYVGDYGLCLFML